ncbi:carboxypeptidase-like regulatory domain-containing protein [Hymenobacter sp.]|jgi:hypothetical protein|uniref:carboxypeptidase-like regulatory domain-containing protein n=1 Tax=Hymenobacter sp. TaxID=1898978 RepID=UPI002EDA2A63
MVLSASPFDAKTGALMPVYRDAYLRGDLSRENTALVDAYLKKNASLGDQTWQRFHAMQQAGEQVQAVGWVQRQFDLIRTEPQRFRRRAGTVATGIALIGGTVFAGTNLPNANTEASAELVASTEAASSASSLRMVTVRGRILDENGRPLIGATVMEKGSARGVSTNANGEYVMAVPANSAATLSYDYSGYTGDEIQVRGNRTENVTLVPSETAPAKPAKKAKRWLLF